MDFKQYLMEQKLADTTIKAHIRNLDRFGKLTDTPILQQVEERSYIEKEGTRVTTTSYKMSMAGTISKYLKYNISQKKREDYPKDEEEYIKEKKKEEEPIIELYFYIKDMKEKFQEEKDAKMAEMTLPTIKDIKDHMNNLYEKGDYRSYVILYLMTQYQVRNMDMIANVVGSKRDTNKTDNWFVSTPSQVTWIRNKYKTSSVYGTKTHIIKNQQFMNAIQQLEYVLKPNDNVDRVIKIATSEIGSITEGTIAKIVLAENNNMNSLKKVSKNRGTSAGKLIESYNIT